MKSARSKFSTLKQICTYIPGHLVAKLARSQGIDKKCRTFSPWSHVVSLLYAQLAHSSGLNNVCDELRLHKGKLGAIRGCASRKLVRLYFREGQLCAAFANWPDPDPCGNVAGRDSS